MDLMTKLLAHIAGALTNLKPFALVMVGSFATMDFILYFLLEKEEDVLYTYVKKVLLYGVLITLITNYDEIVLKTFLNGAVQLGNRAVGNNSIKLVISPLTFFYRTLSLAAPAFGVSTLGALSVDALLDVESLPVGMVLIILGMFCSALLLSYELAMVFVEFYIVAVTAIVLIPFGAFYKTRGIAIKAIGAIFGQGVKIMVMTFLLNFFDQAWQEYVLTRLENDFSLLSWRETAICTLVILILYGTIKRGPAIAHAILAGAATSGTGTSGFLGGLAGGSLGLGYKMARSGIGQAYSKYKSQSQTSSYNSADKH